MQDENYNLAKTAGSCLILRGYGGKNDKEETA